MMTALLKNIGGPRFRDKLTPLSCSQTVRTVVGLAASDMRKSLKSRNFAVSLQFVQTNVSSQAGLHTYALRNERPFS